jgi:hypothetical protein
MPKRITPLTDTKVRTAKPAEKPKKLFDGGGSFSLGYSDWRQALAVQVSFWG